MNHTIPTAAALLLSNTRIAAMEGELEQAAAAIAERDGRLIELNARIKALKAGDTQKSDQKGNRQEPVAARKAVEPFSFPASVPSQSGWVSKNEQLPQEGELLLTLSGLVLGTAQKFDEPADAQVAFTKSLKAIFLFSRMLGQAPATEVQLRSNGVRCAIPAESPGSWPVLSLDASIDILDLWFSDIHGLRLRCNADQPVVLRCYQHDLDASGAVVMVSEVLLQGSGMAVVEARLLNPFLPLLITSSAPDGVLLSSTLLPFPSLVRGGKHAGEVCAVAGGEHHFDTLRKLSKKLLYSLFSAEQPLLAQLCVDLSHATGAEPLFATHFKQWLAAVMGIVMQPVLETLPEHAGRRSFLQGSLNAALPAGFSGQALQEQRAVANKATLTLPADGLPSLHLLTARATQRGEIQQRVGSFIACDHKTGAPRQLIVIPDTAEDLTKYQPVTRPVWPVLTGAAPLNRGLVPLALRFCDAPPATDPRMVLPLGATTLAPLLQAARQVKGRIAILLNGGDATGFRASLTRQTVADEVDVLVNPGAGLDAPNASQLTDASFILVADSGVILYDPHTLEILRLLASLDNVASAGCSLIGQSIIKNKPVMTFMDGGLQALIPSHATKISMLSRFDIRTALPFATLPTVGNSHKFFMVRADVWRQLGGFAMDSADSYALQAIDAGYQHLTTDAVRASIAQDQDATAPNTVPLPDQEKLQGIGEKACVFKELSA